MRSHCCLSVYRSVSVPTMGSRYQTMDKVQNPSNSEPLGKVYDRLCGLVVRVSGYRSRGPGFDSRGLQIF
jgi:hypothetical protein